MNKSIIVLSAFSLILFADGKLSPSCQKCLDESTSDFAMVKCIQVELKIQDNNLNKFYKSAMKTLEISNQTKLKETQKLWINYRDAKCNFYSALTGGTMDTLNTASCFLTETSLRTKELELIADNLF